MTDTCPHCLQKLPTSNQFGPLKAFPESNAVILGSEQYKLSPMQTKMMVLFIERFNLPIHVLELQKHMYKDIEMRSQNAVWMHISILSDRLANTGYKIEHVCSATWRLCKDEPVQQSNKESP